MRLIVDTNILISGLIRDSITRRILLNPKFEFYLPDFSLSEIKKYLPEISKKSGLSAKEVKELLNSLLDNFYVIPLKEYKFQLKRATEIIGSIDEKDVPFIAVALCIKSYGIWSNNGHFQEQNEIKTYTTAEIIRLI